jgi:small subunit ribosomal protein S1
MEARTDARQPSPEDSAWWTEVDEGYWQALLEQGEVAPDTMPPNHTQDFFPSLPPEMEAETPGSSAIVDPGHDAGSEEVWHEAQLALDRGEVFPLRACGANRGGLLVEWNGMQGFVPASHLKEMPHFIDPRDRVFELNHRVGDELSVSLIEVDPQLNRLVFSERAAVADNSPPAAILNTLKPGDLCQGTVTSLTSFGAFVDLGGVEGLVHVSEISWDRVRHPSDALRPGEVVEVRVLGVRPEEKRVALSLKRLRPDPWAQVESSFQVGQIIEGTVTNVVSFGAFVRVAEGVEGLIHISELAEGNFLHPRNVVRESDVVRVRVLNVDTQHHRLGLSLRQVRDTDQGPPE